MTTTQEAAIEKHGRQLLAIFPNATEQDPVKLCRKLRRLENQAAELALRGCKTGFDSDEEADELYGAVLVRVETLLQNRECDTTAKDEPRVPVFINRDPRGYQLKIADGWMRDCRHELPLEQDWGGYGILAPEIGKDGHG